MCDRGKRVPHSVCNAGALLTSARKAKASPPYPSLADFGTGRSSRRLMGYASALPDSTMCSFVNPCDAWFKRKSIAGAQSIYWNISKFTVNPSPAGTPENSPAIHRWVIARERKSPERDERTPLLANRTRNAGLGYSRLPLRDGKIAPAPLRQGAFKKRGNRSAAMSAR